MTTSPLDLAKLVEPVREIAARASEQILKIYETDFAVAEKQDRSPLTAADLASHEAIVAGLKALTPELPILSEESVGIPFAERSGWSRYWLVDPLDGTKEFIKKNGEFTVNIALIEKNTPVLGVIYAPAFETLYFGKKGEGAYKREKGSTVPLSVRQKKDHWTAVGSRSHSSS